MKAVNIKWNTEGYNVNLPPEAELPDNVKEDMVADFLSDTFGFCVFGFQITKNYAVRVIDNATKKATDYENEQEN